MMNTTDYQKYCEDFFKQGSFQSQEQLNQEIGSLTPLEFQDWRSAMFQKYNEKYEVVRELIKGIRQKANFNTTAPDIDWDIDPIHKEEHRTVVKAYQDICNDVFENECTKYPLYVTKCNELKEYILQQHREESLKVQVEGQDFVAEKIIDIYWTGWECDNHAWLVNDNGQKKVVATNHGTAYFADKEFLEGKIKEYQEAIKQTQDMLEGLKPTSKLKKN